MAKRKSMAGGEIIRDAQIYDVAVIGGGAAGCMAACAASENGARTLILEANDRIGRKNLCHRQRTLQPYKSPCG